jgi:hypothetical protein
VSAVPALPPPPVPRIAADIARAAASRAFTSLGPVLPADATMVTAADWTCDSERCVWRSSVIAKQPAVVGSVEVDGTTGEVTFVLDDGRNQALAPAAFLAREAARKKAVAAVAGLPLVKAYCAALVKLRLGCVLYVAEDPSEQGCAPDAPLESSCWVGVYVGEAHDTHVSRFATFLVAPGSSRVVGAAGYCGPVPIASFHDPASGCVE